MAIATMTRFAAFVISGLLVGGRLDASKSAKTMKKCNIFFYEQRKNRESAIDFRCAFFRHEILKR